MKQTATAKSTSNSVELATFYVGDALCGIDILDIQEINKIREMTKVPQAPEYVMGILNLRGQIVTIIDLGKKLGLASTEPDDESRNIIVNSKGEYIGFLVDRISDVLIADTDRIEPPPANIGGMQGRFFEGVFKTDNNLFGVLNMDEVLKADD